MTHFFVFILSLVGFAMLHMAMARHQRDWLSNKLSDGASRVLRLAGFASLLLAFLVAGRGFGWGYGSIVWIGSLTLAALLVAAANTARDPLRQYFKRIAGRDDI